MKLFCLLVLMIIFNHPLQAQMHYIKTHKSLLALDGLVFTASAFDAHSSNLCQARETCFERNPFAPIYPTRTQMWTGSMSVALGVTAVSHLLWHFLPKHREIVFAGDGSYVAFQGIYNIPNNYRLANEK